MKRQEAPFFKQYMSVKPDIKHLSAEEMNQNTKVMYWAIGVGMTWGEPIEIAYIARSEHVPGSMWGYLTGTIFVTDSVTKKDITPVIKLLSYPGYSDTKTFENAYNNICDRFGHKIPITLFHEWIEERHRAERLAQELAKKADMTIAR